MCDLAASDRYFWWQLKHAPASEDTQISVPGLLMSPKRHTRSGDLPKVMPETDSSALCLIEHQRTSGSDLLARALSTQS